ncbi:Cysteine-rich receptor-like protein kinase 5 [Camellia lanceoleosa]|uniref:Cysteine-rich receptor-like protein kinase 5 n=1 Tax=Camellia lanceoleosa TaxID=1840588 RepID=A0ACC0HXG1_9ERIC|nr:Cysteine-rich receptor-like protein kinase 5 [Camellia lanceoleosa]
MGGEIAVKKPLLISDKGKELVLSEMKLLLGSAHHRNIVKFLGFCSHREEMLLALEFASNGSLDHLLFKFDPELRPTMDRVYSTLLENHSNSSTLVEEPLSDGSSSSSSTTQNSGRKELANNGSSSGTNIHLGNEGLPIQRRLTRSRRIQPEDVQSYILSIPSSSCSSSDNGIQIEPDEGPVRATIQEVAAAKEEEDEEGIPIPMITKEDPIETMGKLCPRNNLARQPREKTPLLPPRMTKEAAKNVAKQQQTIEEEANEKSPTTLNDTEEWPVNSTPKDRVVMHRPLHLVLSFHHTINSNIFVYLLYEQIMPEIKVDKERMATNDAKEDFWQAITKLKSLETSFRKSWNDEGNKSSWCEDGFFEQGEKGKYKDQLTNPQDAIFSNNWEGILRKVGVAEDSLLFSEVPLPGLVEQQLPTAEEAVDDGDHGGEWIARGC